MRLRHTLPTQPEPVLHIRVLYVYISYISLASIASVNPTTLRQKGWLRVEASRNWMITVIVGH